ncbi:hypothetical protein J6590_102852 [Homalodisca vitripennis]|nr:hypothetical protein J6590_016262 [Homalodisca vitripennis]KAG8299365.1 hypothetical protein J6590_102852 [Homalodisca vitripennis]
MFFFYRSTLHVQPFFPHSFPHSRKLQNLQTSCRPNVLRLTVGVTSLTLYGEERGLRVLGQADRNNNKETPQKTNNLSCINNKLKKLTLSESVPPKLLVETRLPSTANVVEAKNNYNKAFLSSSNENTKVINVNQLNDNPCGHDNRTQLLHPDWRKIPWKPYFGWTDAHDKLQKQLKEKIREGTVESIYYKSQEEHVAAGLTWRYHNKDVPFLRGPTVSTVCEVLEVIRRVNSTRPHNYCSNRLSRWNRQDNLANVDYDADDED